jgi:phosphoglycolate phosphatase-like HAD superfamily hydrolase
MTQPNARFLFPVTHKPGPVMDQTVALVRESRGRGRAPVVLFDLDGTLFDNGPRSWQILYEFALSRGHHTLSQKLNGMPKQLLPYSLREILAQVDATDPDLLQEAAVFWKKRFFVDDYIRFDEPVRGAIQFVHRVYNEGATVVYFSGRDAPNMLVGTAQSLRTHGFPVGVPRAVITLKETFEVEDLVFKRQAVAFLNTLGEVVGTFDNEPANCNMFLEHWPHAVTAALATTHAPSPQALVPQVMVIEDFVE